MPNFATVRYPGITCYEDFTITDVAGISPAIGIMTIYPQDNLPEPFGDIVLEYNQTRITFKNMCIDAANYERDSGGKIVKVRFLDERWKWQFGDITGKYNIRLPNNLVDPDHEKSPRELARLCFAKMGIEEYSTANLPDDARPEVDWDHANPALCLQKLCDDLGCRIVPKRSTGEWIICVTGEGAVFPDQGWPYQDPSDGINPKERPDFIKIVTAPWKYQIAMDLWPVSRDTDYSWQDLENVSYAPGSKYQNGMQVSDGYGFGNDLFGMSNIDPTRVRQADGTAISPRELALQTVFKCFRINGNYFSSKGKSENTSIELFKTERIAVPGYLTDTVDVKQIIPSDELVQVYLDEKGGEHKRPAYCFGRFYLQSAEGDGNVPAGTRFDKQIPVFQENDEEIITFNMAIDPLDTTKTRIITSHPVVQVWTHNSTPPTQTFGLANINLVCSVQVRDAETWQPHRYEHLVQVGDGNNEENCLVVIKDDIQPWTIVKYDEFGDYVSHTENADELQRQCNYYAAAIAKTYEIVGALRRTFIGLYAVDMDGLTCQVSYKISKQGADTIVSAGTEHDFDIPSYEDKRQMWSRKSEQNFMKYMAERQRRLDRLKGTSDTL